SKLQMRVTLLSALPDDYFRFRSLWCGNNGSAQLNDSCFFLRNLIDGLAEPFLVVEIDRGNDANRRLYRVSGIEAPAHPGFEHQNFAARFLKMLQRQSCRDFKKCRMRIPTANLFPNFGEADSDFGY